MATLSTSVKVTIGLDIGLLLMFDTSVAHNSTLVAAAGPRCSDAELQLDSEDRPLCVYTQ